MFARFSRRRVPLLLGSLISLALLASCQSRRPTPAITPPPRDAITGPRAHQVIGGTETAGQVAMIDYEIGGAITHGNLVVFPVYAKQETPETDYLTLDEALAAGVLIVEELPEPVVERVLVTNTAKKPIYIMAGEIIIGGQQDRTVGKDTVILPGVKKVELEVFCVEHGRWEGEVAFGGSPGMAKPAVRKAAHADADQSQVWAEVAEARAGIASAAAGTSYRAVARPGGEAQARTQPYIDAISAKLSQDERAVGAIVALNGQVVCADVFNDARLFQKQQAKLLRSYAVEAWEQREAENADRRPAPADAVQFIEAARSAEPSQVEKSGRSETIHRAAGGVIAIQTNAPAAAPADMPADGEAEQVPVHQTFYAQ